MVGGIFDKALSSVFPASGSVVGNAANVIGGAMLSSGQPGALNQIMQAKSDIGRTSIMSNSLNSAANGMSSNFGLVGDVANSVFNAGQPSQAGSTRDFGTLVRRMTTSNGAKPTPLESLATMVTKQNAKGSTKA